MASGPGEAGETTRRCPSRRCSAKSVRIDLTVRVVSGGSEVRSEDNSPTTDRRAGGEFFLSLRGTVREGRSLPTPSL